MQSLNSHKSMPAKGHWLRGKIYAAQGNHARAVREITEAIANEVYNEEWSWFVDRAKSYRELGEVNAALADLNYVIMKLAAYEPKCYTERAVVFELLGEPGAAKKDRQKAKKLAKNAPPG